MLFHRPGETSRTWPRSTVATVVLLAIALAGCSGPWHEPETVALPAPGTTPSGTAVPNDPEGAPRNGGKLVVAVPADVNGWNPNMNQWTDGGTMMGPSMLEPLAVTRPDGEAEPWLAESWVPNEDFTVWNITVRDGIKFHNGQPLDAAALKGSLEAFYSKGLSSVALASLYDRVDIAGPRTVTVHLRIEWAQYPASLNSAYMIAPAVLERKDEGTVAPIGTGPFKYVDWQPGKWLKVTRNDNYWRRDAEGRQLPHLNEIEFRPIIADDARQAALLDGSVDLVLTSSPTTAAVAEHDHTVIRDYTTERTMILLNTDEGQDNRPNPFTNVHARRALAHATNSAELARIVGDGVSVTTAGYRPDSRWGLPASETNYPSFDPVAARRELDVYKRETGKRELRFTLKSIPEPRLMSVLQRAQAQWKDVGITASIETMDQVPFSIIVPMGRYQAGYYRGYGFANPDQNTWFLSGANTHPIGELSLNFTHFRSTTLERNLRTQRENTEFSVRKAAINAIDRELNDQALQIWLFDTPWAIVAQPQVKGLRGFRSHAFGNFDTKPWWGEVWLQS